MSLDTIIVTRVMPVGVSLALYAGLLSSMQFRQARQSVAYRRHALNDFAGSQKNWGAETAFAAVSVSP